MALVTNLVSTPGCKIKALRSIQPVETNSCSARSSEMIRKTFKVQGSDTPQLSNLYINKLDVKSFILSLSIYVVVLLFFND